MLPATRQRCESRLYPKQKQVLDLATPEGCKAELTYVTWKWTGRDLNLRPVNRKSNALLQCQHARRLNNLFVVIMRKWNCRNSNSWLLDSGYNFMAITQSFHIVSDNLLISIIAFSHPCIFVTASVLSLHYFRIAILFTQQPPNLLSSQCYWHICLMHCAQEEDFPGAIQLCLECQKAASTYKHYHCIRSSEVMHISHNWLAIHWPPRWLRDGV